MTVGIAISEGSRFGLCPPPCAHARYICDTGASPWLGARPSVRLGGIRALLCVPLAGAGGPIGAIYADSRQPGPPVTDLDLELVGNVALHASGAIEAARIGERLAGLVGALAEEASAAPRWDRLREPA